MEQWYDEIIEEYGAPSAHIKFKDDELRSISSAIPSTPSDFIINFGKSVLRSGRLQTCHPDDMSGVLALIFEGDEDFSHKNCHVFAYSAFGTLFFWMYEYGVGSVDIYTGRVTQKEVSAGTRPEAIPATITVPFWLSDEALDFIGENGKPLFKHALGQIGQIEIGECYGFVPALGLGGKADIASLKRLKAREHFAIVAQTMAFKLIDTQGYGNSVNVRRVGLQ